MPSAHDNVVVTPEPAGATGTRPKRRSRVFSAHIMPTALPALLPGAVLLAQPTRSKRKKQPPSEVIALDIGAPVPTTNATSVFQAGLGSLGCCGCTCCSLFTVFCSTTIPTGIPVATVTITSLDGMTTIDSGTTDSNGRVKLCYPSAGHYLISVSGSGHNDFSDRDYLLNCGRPVLIGVCFQTCVYVVNCNGNVPVSGVTITSSSGGSAVTVRNGCALVPVPSAGTYTFTATWGGQTASQTETVTGNGICSYLEVAFAIWRAQTYGCTGNQFGSVMSGLLARP